MSGPLLFFIFIIVIDLILKSVKNKKNIEENRSKKEMSPEYKPGTNEQKPTQNPGSIRGIMETLREEVEKERQKEIERRQGQKNNVEEIKITNEEEIRVQKTFEKEESWNSQRKSIETSKLSKEQDSQKNNKNINIREDVLKGIIFSEILSEPKSIKNQRRSM